MNDRWRARSALLHQGAVDAVTITCPVCGHSETMSQELADKYGVASDQLCEDCFGEITKK